MKNNTSKYPQNPNPRAKIGFVLIFPFFYHIHKNIYKHVRKDAEFIIDVGGFHSTGKAEEILQELIHILQQNSAHYRILFHEDYFNDTYLKKFVSKYQALVSPWEFRGIMQSETTLGIKKINTPYGAAKELGKLRPTRGMFDLIFASGPREEKLYSYYTRAEIIGVPRFDGWFNKTLDKKFIQEVRKKLDPKKKTVLHLPTHSDLAETHGLVEEIGALSNEFNVITKLHYITLRSNTEVEAKFRTQKNILVFRDDVDLVCLLELADVVLADNSSAIFDAILADKPVLVSNFINAEYFDEGHRKARAENKRGKTFALTYSQSIEQEVKAKGMIPVFRTKKALRSALRTTLKDPYQYKKNRKDIRKELFSFNDGKSGKRAATLIRQLLKEKRPRQRPIMYHAIRAYEKFLDVPYSSEPTKNYKPD
jgi:hypothetical protein